MSFQIFNREPNALDRLAELIGNLAGPPVLAAFGPGRLVNC